MSAALAIPAEVLERALTTAAREVLEKVDAPALTMLDARAAAKMLGLTPQAFREIATDHFDFGERRTRWSLKEIQALVESRRVKGTKK